MALTDVLILAPDVAIVPVERVHEDVRRRLGCSPGDHVVTRPHSRARSLLIDAATAQLLEAFRRPTEVVPAVLAYASLTGEDARAVLDGVYPALRRMHTAGLLVAVGSAAAAALVFRLQANEELDGWRVLHGVQTLEESEVYCARGPDGELAALKIARAPGDTRICELLDHERRVLKRLPSHLAPGVLGAGVAYERAYLAIEWIDGVDALSAARRSYAAGHGSAAVLELCARVFDAYAELHAAGVLHADVQPKNILIKGSGEVRLIDFGLARLVGPQAGGLGPARQGVGYFFEPEYASAPGRPATVQGEVYGITALVYLLLAGDHYLEFPLGRGEFLEAIANRPPLPFAARGCTPWPAVERVLEAGLAKDPNARAPSAAWMATALRAAAAVPGGPLPGSAGAAPTVAPELQEYHLDGAAFERGIQQSPTGSFHYGAAGLAYALYRVAAFSEDADALAAADVWAARAAVGASDARWWNPTIGITSDVTGSVALHHTGLGVVLVQTLIALARWEPEAVTEAVQRYVAAAERADDRPDLVHGLSGALLGCALLAETLPDDPLLPRDAVLACGRVLAARLAILPAPATLGIAHGRAGMLYAQLRFAQAAGLLPSPDICDQLDALRAHAMEAGDGALLWPGRAGQSAVRDTAFISGWCNGAAGFTHLFLLAHRLLGKGRFADWALAAARAAATDPEIAPSICCGLGGRVYALLAVHRATADDHWLERARRLADRIAPPPAAPHTPEHSLYKGALGLRLLRIELDAPECARHPLFEPEGWPRRSRLPRLALEGAR